ncbi:hypothetical protein SCLARK_001448 [Spiroplasma clarkii]|uniref:Uncharacterized protein n=1 Tax=Spiroplasma clarkii TaxID=2139 RepID=A0A1Y0L2L8_9MOLU|nr:hypothetical protein [Spiroplasma clarkii]ARU91965.1 hypothetical protein SCLARK_001448 [Spiroplasma clarkii]ATX71306.1 hypothetical protein SCLAR_v1c10040 [Spiroplasma clarkii]
MISKLQISNSMHSLITNRRARKVKPILGLINASQQQSQPQTGILTRYSQLLNSAIREANFYEIKKQCSLEFARDPVLLYELVVLENLTQKILKLQQLNLGSCFEKNQLKIVQGLFLNQIRFDASIWFNLSDKQRQVINSEENVLVKHLNLDLINVEDNRFKLSYKQKQLIIKISQSKLYDDLDLGAFEPESYKSVQNIIAMFKLYKETIKFEATGQKYHFKKLKQATVSQIISRLIRQNIIENQV